MGGLDELKTCADLNCLCWVCSTYGAGHGGGWMPHLSPWGLDRAPAVLVQRSRYLWIHDEFRTDMPQF